MTVFANGLEVSCKAQANKVIAAFPYVCMTPPQTPATPPGVPVPYPTFSMDDDTDKGTSTAKIGNGTVTQKNLSYYSKCTGNEAGCAPMKNVITHVNTGKAYSHAWSGNVKMDGEPISRFSDICTNDHASSTGGGGPQGNVSSANLPMQEENKPKCPCCKEDAHPNQVDASGKSYPPITYTDYYTEKAKALLTKTTDPNIRREIEAKLKAVLDALNGTCPNIHRPPDAECGKHFIVSQTARDVCEAKEPAASRTIEQYRGILQSQGAKKISKKIAGHYNTLYRQYILGFNSDVKDQRREIATKAGNPLGPKDKCNHLTPLSAGGCPSHMNNLMYDSELSPECKNIDKYQTDFQGVTQ